MYPYLTIFQDLRYAETLPSYNTPSPEPTETLSYTVKTSEPDQTSTASSLLTVEIHPPKPLDEPAPSNHESSMTSFYTTPSGSQSNPIDIDLIPNPGFTMSAGNLQVCRRHPVKNTCRSCTCSSGSDYSHGSWQIQVLIFDFCRYLQIPANICQFVIT